MVTVYHDDDEAFDLWKKIAGLPESRIIRIATSRQFLGDGRHRPLRPLLGDLLRPRRHDSRRPAGLARGGRRPLHRDLEPRRSCSSSTLPGGERVALPHALDRHRHGARARRRGAAGQARQLRHRPVARADPRQRRGDRASIPTGRTRSRTASSPTICAPSAFLVADGVLPSNEGRGYVLRRIMRRAMRHAQLLGAREPLMWRLVPALAREMGQAYPELLRAEALITETLKLEETRFRATLARGLAILEEETRDLTAGGKLAGEVAFKLYDTYGFPLDLTQDALRAARHRRRRRRLRLRRWSASAPKRARPGRARARRRPRPCGSRCANGSGPTEFLGYETEERRGRRRPR